mmetsp:Transcript_50252/g.151286  ORF Transcript_50252/g.151286 Transcript_50252/m.151286 type:complete len:125 (-) Transcript_50252:1941-2315(-)
MLAANNSLTGKLPPDLFKLESIQKLRLEDNSLSGSIPREVMYALHNSTLRSVTLHFNNFGGKVRPDCRDLCRQNGKHTIQGEYVFTADCARPTGTRDEPRVTCPCCTDCCDPLARTCMSERCKG